MEKQRQRTLAALAIITLITGCGGRTDEAAQACLDAARSKASGQSIDVDLKALAALATPDGEDAFRIRAPIVLDAGLSSELKQTLDCRVRLTANGPEITSLTFVF